MLLHIYCKHFNDMSCYYCTVDIGVEWLQRLGESCMWSDCVTGWTGEAGPRTHR